MFYTFPSFEKLKTSLLTSCHHIDPCISIIVARAPTTTPPTLSTTATQAPSTPSASVPPPSKRSFPIFSNSNQMFRRAPMCANWGWILTRWRSNSRIRSLTSAHQTGFSHQIDPKTMIDPRTYVIIDQPHDWPKLWRQSSFALFRCLLVDFHTAAIWLLGVIK